MTMPSVTMYTTPTCGFCYAAKAFFQQNNVAFIEKDVTADLDAQREMIMRTGQLGVPVIDVNGEVVIGFDQARLRQLLNL